MTDIFDRFNNRSPIEIGWSVDRSLPCGKPKKYAHFKDCHDQFCLIVHNGCFIVKEGESVMILEEDNGMVNIYGNELDLEDYQNDHTTYYIFAKCADRHQHLYTICEDGAIDIEKSDLLLHGGKFTKKTITKCIRKNKAVSTSFILLYGGKRSVTVDMKPFFQTFRQNFVPVHRNAIPQDMNEIFLKLYQAGCDEYTQEITEFCEEYMMDDGIWNLAKKSMSGSEEELTEFVVSIDTEYDRIDLYDIISNIIIIRRMEEMKDDYGLE